MSTSARPFDSGALPITGGLKLAYLVSILIALILGGASVIGILSPSTIYTTEDLRQTFLPNDIVNLIIGVPVLLISMWWSRRRKLIGLLFWPGALFFVLYTYIVYMLAMPPSLVFLLYLTLVALSAYTLIGLVGSIDAKAVQQQLAGAVPERFAGGVLIGLGTLFLLRTIGVITSAVTSGTPIPQTDAALLITDFLLNPAWIIGGVLLWRRQASGYVLGLGLLFQGSMLFIGLIVFLLLQSLLTGAPFAPVDVIVTFVLGLICFIPFILFSRGAAVE